MSETSPPQFCKRCDVATALRDDLVQLVGVDLQDHRERKNRLDSHGMQVHLSRPTGEIPHSLAFEQLLLRYLREERYGGDTRQP